MAFDWVAGTALVVGVGSLYLTYQSTKSAKRAIETSIELYEKQKKDDEIRVIKENNNEINALKTIIYEEVKNNYSNFRFVDDFIKITLEDKLIKFAYKTMVNKPYIDYSTTNEESILVPLKIHSTKVMDNYLLDASRLDEELITLLIETRRLTDNYNEAFLLGFNDFLSKNPSAIAVKIYLKETKGFHESYKDSCLATLRYCLGLESTIK